MFLFFCITMTVGLALVWWTDVGQARFPRITVVSRQFLTIPVDSATTERVFSFAGLTLSDLRFVTKIPFL